MTKQDTIKLVENSFSSIFSKEDVLKLLRNISGLSMNDGEIETLLDRIMNRLITEDTIVDLGSAEFEIDFENRLSLTKVDLDEDVIRDEIKRTLVEFTA